MSGKSDTDIPKIFAALKFAAEKHKGQHRKGKDAAPYINHPIEVAEILARVGGISDTDILVAAILHDTLEDTHTTADELRTIFGDNVMSMVKECTDDKELPKTERKRLQIEHAKDKSAAARQIKIADKISNMASMGSAPPVGWPHERILQYIAWSEKVVQELSGVNQRLEDFYSRVLEQTQKQVSGKQGKS
jgi:guanosine-3',5'-bis(diphosphate) 3'-pyrophosphohydrolase